jgi:hypothetical protein
MEKIPTAKEFCEKKFKEINPATSWIDFNKEVMIEFAKLHVEAALKEASSKVTCSEEYQYDEYDNAILIAKINRDSILNSYPLDNIK